MMSCCGIANETNRIAQSFHNARVNIPKYYGGLFRSEKGGFFSEFAIPDPHLLHPLLALTYTSHDMAPFARDMGHDGPPFAWDEERHLHLRSQLDALFFLLYGLDREEADYALSTFPIVKRQDEAAFGGRYRTRDLILAYMNAYAAGNLDAWARG